MGTFGPAAESLRLSDHYRRLTDDELIAIAQDTSDLTEMAQQALATEISQRKLSVAKQETLPPSPPPDVENEVDDPYAEDRQLVEITRVWSLPDALKLQLLLDQAEIPFFMGQEKATRAEAVTANFRNGVAAEVMQVGAPWALANSKGWSSLVCWISLSCLIRPSPLPVFVGCWRSRDITVSPQLVRYFQRGRVLFR
jgi:hypothetical protein